MEKMDKHMYPQMPDTPDAPPTYNQAIYPPEPASAPTAPMIPMVPTASMAPMQPMQPMVPPQGHPQQPSFAQPQAIYVQSPTLPPLGPRPTMVICPSCHTQKMSTIRYETGSKTHLFAALLCILGLFCCACIPYCVDNCKNPNHYCSNCDAYLGMYK